MPMNQDMSAKTHRNIQRTFCRAILSVAVLGLLLLQGCLHPFHPRPRFFRPPGFVVPPHPRPGRIHVPTPAKRHPRPGRRHAAKPTKRSKTGKRRAAKPTKKHAKTGIKPKQPVNPKPKLR